MNFITFLKYNNINEDVKLYFYHGTTSDNIKTIVKNGLSLGGDKLVWATTNRETAFNNGSLRTWYNKKDVSLKPVIVKITITDNISDFKKSGSKDVYWDHVIPKNNIEILTLTLDEISDFEHILKGIKRRNSFS